jgi:metal-responsive CopG/Arc/MetJ family transcriptional regulator
MGNRKALISFDEEILKKLDEYAKNEWKGNRSMAIHDILKKFFEKEEKS